MVEEEKKRKNVSESVLQARYGLNNNHNLTHISAALIFGTLFFRGICEYEAQIVGS